jgi:hypothetical protein
LPPAISEKTWLTAFWSMSCASMKAARSIALHAFHYSIFANTLRLRPLSIGSTLILLSILNGKSRIIDFFTMKKWTLPQISSPKKVAKPFLASLFEQNLTVNCQIMTLTHFYFGLKMTLKCRSATSNKQKNTWAWQFVSLPKPSFLNEPVFFWSFRDIRLSQNDAFGWSAATHARSAIVSAGCDIHLSVIHLLQSFVKQEF